MADKVVKVQAGKKVVNVKMETNATALADVVVTGYQTLVQRTGNRILFCDFREKHEGGKLETDVLSRIERLVAGINKTPVTVMMLLFVVLLLIWEIQSHCM